MNKNKTVTGEIAGHTDSIGNDVANLALSKQRAETVRSLLISLGIEEQRVRAIGKGESEPKGDNGTPEGRLMNRRVEVTLKNEDED
jgi:OOP family OmpA-OmpF porin